MTLQHGPNSRCPIQPNVAREILDRVDAFFSNISYATRGTLLNFHDGAGVIPTRCSTETAFETWGNHTHGIGEGNMELPSGVTWNHLERAGLIDRRNGLLRIDLLRIAAGEPAAE